MKNTFIVFTLLFSLEASGQTTLYGLAKVQGSNKILYMSSINPANGYVNVFSGPLMTNHLSVFEGNAFDFTRGYYYYLIGTYITRVDVHSGSSQLFPVNLSGSYPDAPLYTCRDSSIYMFSRNGSSIAFGKYSVDSGQFISPAINFSTFPQDDYTYDKVNHKYIFPSGNLIYMIDLNTMNVDTFNLPIPSHNYFHYPQYDCYDSLIYGSYVLQGSLATYLATYNLATGAFNILSQTPFTYGSMGGSNSALDIKNGLYYFNTGTSILSVRLADGSLAANNSYNYSISGPSNIYYIEINQECDCERQLNLSSEENNLPHFFLNSFNDEFRVEGISASAHLKLYDISSRLILEKNFQSDIILNISDLPAGVYIYSLDIFNQHMTGKFKK
jgi:hypothetical protein